MASDAPIILGPGEGEVAGESETRSSRIKVARDELLLFESSYAPDQRVARPHVHKAHADAFYVLEGSLLFHLAGEQRPLPAGALALAPPGLVHGFDIGPEGARHLNLHTPGRAFAQLSRARRDGVEFDAANGDTFSPPDDGGLPADDAVVSLPNEGERIPPTARFLLKAARPEVAMLEFDVEPGFGSALHLHRQHHDSYYVLAGELELGLGSETVLAIEGTFVSIPPGVAHVWTNTGSDRARFLNVHAPGSWFERYLRERAELELSGGEPDRAFFEQHDIFDL